MYYALQRVEHPDVEKAKDTPSKDPVSSPPSQRRRTDSSPAAPPPSSPGAALQSELPLFSSPAGAGGSSRFHGNTSEIDLSSPLNYGTPSSHRNTPRTPGAAGTPIRPRPDVRSERKMRTVNMENTAVSREFEHASFTELLIVILITFRVCAMKYSFCFCFSGIGLV